MICRYNANRLVAVISIPVLVFGLASARAADRTDDENTGAGDDAVVTVTRKVATADLNLALPDDQRRLRHRLSVAARRVCLEAGGTTAVQDDSMLRCYETSMHEAWAAVQDRVQVASANSHLIANSQKQTPIQSQEVASSLSK